MSTIPEFPLEKLSKEELLRLIVQLPYGLTGNRMKELAYEVREQTLWNESCAASAAHQKAFASYCEINPERLTKRAEARLAYLREAEKDQRAYRRWEKFSQVWRDAVTGGASCVP